MKFHKNGKGITCVVGVILFVVICASIFSKQKFYVSNGIMHEITWRYYRNNLGGAIRKSPVKSRI